MWILGKKGNSFYFWKITFKLFKLLILGFELLGFSEKSLFNKLVSTTNSSRCFSLKFQRESVTAPPPLPNSDLFSFWIFSFEETLKCSAFGNFWKFLKKSKLDPDPENYEIVSFFFLYDT